MSTFAGKRTPRKTLGLTAIAVGAIAAVGLAVPMASGFTAPGTPGRDVHIGLDNDNADNPFVQPPGVAAKQHMDDTDILSGRGNQDLLIGKLGDDVLFGGPGGDIMVGGPERFTTPNSDVMVGDGGDDVNIWAPGDGSDAFLGNDGHDTMIFAPFVTQTNGDLKLERFGVRRIPRVDIGGLPPLSCTIVPVPAEEKLGVDFLVRFNVNGAITVTVRLNDVERVFCPSPQEGYAVVADLTDAHPAFEPVRLGSIRGVVGAILAPTG